MYKNCIVLLQYCNMKRAVKFHFNTTRKNENDFDKPELWTCSMTFKYHLPTNILHARNSRSTYRFSYFKSHCVRNTIILQDNITFWCQSRGFLMYILHQYESKCTRLFIFWFIYVLYLWMGDPSRSLSLIIVITRDRTLFSLFSRFRFFI